MSVNNWDEIRTAYYVAQYGTVSAASKVLGVHHATVIRHIDALESRLGVKLFQRHARGYSATEAGADLRKIASITDDQLTQLVGRIKGRSAVISGELVISTLDSIAEVIAPTLVKFQLANPDIVIKLSTSDQLARLEYGEAHLAIRAGPKSSEPDNVVQFYKQATTRLCAAQSYIDRYGIPTDITDLQKHRFVGGMDASLRAPHLKWLHQHVPADNFVFRSSDARAQFAAVRAGAGIGFMLGFSQVPPDGISIMFDSRDEWQSTLWLVTHVDIHRNPKVQAVLKFLKQEQSKSQNS